MRNRKDQMPWLKEPDRHENWRGKLPFDRREEGYRRIPCDGSMMEQSHDRFAQLATDMDAATSEAQRAEIMRIVQREAVKLLTVHQYSRRVGNAIKRVGENRRAEWLAQQDAMAVRGGEDDPRYGSTYAVHILT